MAEMYQQLKYYHEHREQVIEKCRIYRQKNKEKISLRRKSAYRENRTKILESAKKYYLENREKVLENSREYRKTNHQRILLKNRNRKNAMRSLKYSSDIDDTYLRELIDKSSLCPLCGEKMEVKHVDHIIPICMGGTHTKDNVRVICKKCNLSRPKDGRDLL